MNQENKVHEKIRIVILAGGNASRINKSDINNSEKILIKPFLEIASQPMIFHILFEILSGLELYFSSKKEIFEKISFSIVINRNFQDQHLKKISEFIKKIGFDEGLKIEFVSQECQNGTGGAVLDVLEKSLFKEEFSDEDLFFVFFGDHPLMSEKTIVDFLFKFKDFSEKNQSSKLGMFSCFENENQENQYGRVEIENGFIKKIHEYKDYKDSDEIKKIKFCNGSISLFQLSILSDCLPLVRSENNSGEIYLHGLIDVCLDRNDVFFKAFIIDDSNEAGGVNTFQELYEAEKKFQSIQRQKFSKRKIQFQNLETVIFAPFVSIEDFCQVGAFVQFLPFVKIGEFSKIESFCVLGRDLEIGKNCLIKNHSILNQSKIGDFCEIGPFAHLNSENVISDKNIIGNFTEIKRSQIGFANKAKHFAYIADAKIGSQNNFGSGIVFCNFNGSEKNQTQIGDKNFIGANVSLIAPLKIGDSNLIGAGSVISENIGDEKLALERSKQINKDRKKK